LLLKVILGVIVTIRSGFGLPLGLEVITVVNLFLPVVYHQPFLFNEGKAYVVPTTEAPLLAWSTIKTSIASPPQSEKARPHSAQGGFTVWLQRKVALSLPNWSEIIVTNLVVIVQTLLFNKLK
jgi:hypothetical protein